MALTDACPKCREAGGDRAGNNLVIYEDGGAHCFACKYHVFPSGNASVKKEEGLVSAVSKATAYTKDDWAKCVDKNNDSFTKPYRGVRAEVYKKYMTMIDTPPTKMVSAVTTDGTITGAKVRTFPKQFNSFGQTGQSADLFGQAIFTGSVSKRVVIASGELDAMSAFQLLNDANEEKGWDEIPVVSSLIGETGVAHYKQNYNWLDSFSEIVIIPDYDEAGQNALAAALKVLPPHKVFVLALPTGIKDVNEYLEGGFSPKDFLNRYFKAKRHVPAGIVGSKELPDKMMEYLSIPRISLPPFMHKLQNMLHGGLPLGYVVNILAGSGIGKSTWVDACTIHWILHTQYKVGVVPLESGEGEYLANLLSSMCGDKISLKATPEERIALANTPEFQRNRLLLTENEDGSDRFHLVEADAENLQQKIEYLVRGLGCKIIVLDVLSDLLDELPIDEHPKFMRWMKKFVKREQVTIVNVVHIRKGSDSKTSASTGANVTEESAMGSSTIFKSAGVNIILMRNKEAETEIERNTTIMKMTKSRGVGSTGVVGRYFYDQKTHRLCDADDMVRDVVATY